MRDQYTGQAGTFITDPESGTRMPLEEYQAAQAQAEEQAALEAAPKATAKKAKETD
jgi:hypothetical protein